MKNYKLIEAREDEGYTQNDMAELLNIDKVTYCYKENGNSQFKLDEINIILGILNKKYDDLFLDYKSQKKATK